MRPAPAHTLSELGIFRKIPMDKTLILDLFDGFLFAGNLVTASLYLRLYALGKRSIRRDVVSAHRFALVPAFHVLSLASTLAGRFAAPTGASGESLRIYFSTAAAAFLALATTLRLRSSLLPKPIRTRLSTPQIRSFALPALIALYAAVGAVILVVLRWLDSTPPPLAEELVLSGVRWGVHDKKWVILAYVLAVLIFVALPAFLRRLLAELRGQTGEHESASVLSRHRSTKCSPGEPRSEPAPAERSQPGQLSKSSLRHLSRAAQHLTLLVLGLLIAVHFFGRDFANLREKVGSHELIHLGGLAAIDQGHIPFVEAETQYGPGYQILSHEFMALGDFSLYGFRLSHLVLNLLAMALVYYLYMAVFRWHTAPFLILVSLWISPAIYFGYYGWAVILRWLGPLVVGLTLPGILSLSGRAKPISGCLALGASCGFLAWFASENLFGSFIAFGLLSILGWSLYHISTRRLITAGFAFFGGVVAALTILVVVSVPISKLGLFIELYFRASRSVSQGLSNSPWTAGFENIWTLPYYVTPYLLILVGVLVVYVPEIRRIDLSDQTRRFRLLGIIAAAIPLHMMTMLRSDPTHFIGPSIALGATLVATVAILPGLLTTSKLVRELVRAALAVVIMMIYPLPESLAEVEHSVRPRILSLSEPRVVLGSVRDYVTRVRDERSRTAAGKIGFEFDPEDPCCKPNHWTYAQLVQLMDGLQAEVGERPTVIDKFSGLYPSGAYFFSGVQISVPIEPLISVWTRQDLERWLARISAANPECFVTTDGSGPVAAHTLDMLEPYVTIEKTVPLEHRVFCRPGR